MPLPHNRCQPRTGQPVYNWLRALHWWLFPGHCVLCDLGSGRDFDLCASCEADLPWIQVACPRCAVPLPTPAPACAGCLRRPPSFACTRAPMAYQGVVASLVPLWKKGELPALQRVLVGLLAARVAPGAACAVPSGSKRTFPSGMWPWSMMWSPPGPPLRPWPWQRCAPVPSGLRCGRWRAHPGRGVEVYNTAVAG